MEITQSLKTFGLNEKEQEVYLLLTKHGWITALELSHLSPIKRTTLYRILESLTRRGLVEVQIGDKTTHYNAADPKQFESLIIEQEKIATRMRDSLAQLHSQLTILSSTKSDTTKVRFHRGVRGLKSMEWKMCKKPNMEVLIIGSDEWSSALGKDFAEKIRQEKVRQRITIREILNPENFEPIPADGSVSWTSNKEFVLNHYLHRRIRKKILDIRNEIIITPDAVLIYSFQETEVVGIEIASKTFTDLMRQLFEMVWNQAEVVDNFGGKKVTPKTKK
jgi:sugar-specific transcriptional regulator TrmB